MIDDYDDSSHRAHVPPPEVEARIRADDDAWFTAHPYAIARLRFAAPGEWPPGGAPLTVVTRLPTGWSIRQETDVATPEQLDTLRRHAPDGLAAVPVSANARPPTVRSRYERRSAARHPRRPPVGHAPSDGR